MINVYINPVLTFIGVNFNFFLHYLPLIVNKEVNIACIECILERILVLPSVVVKRVCGIFVIQHILYFLCYNIILYKCYISLEGHSFKVL